MAARNNNKYQYLLSKRVTCGLCGYKMNGATRCYPSGHALSYYVCNSRWRENTNHDCRLPRFRVDQIDLAVWEWVKSFFVDPAALTHGLQAEQADRDEVNRPLRDRLTVVDALLADSRKQLTNLLDLYLAGDFPRDMLTDRKVRLEKTIAALERERSGLTAQIETQTLTADQIQTIVDFAVIIREGLEKADADFDARRHLIETLGVWVTLTIEDGERIAYVRCMLGERALPIVSTTTNSPT